MASIAAGTSAGTTIASIDVCSRVVVAPTSPPSPSISRRALAPRARAEDQVLVQVRAPASAPVSRAHADGQAHRDDGSRPFERGHPKTRLGPRDDGHRPARSRDASPLHNGNVCNIRAELQIWHQLRVDWKKVPERFLSRSARAFWLGISLLGVVVLMAVVVPAEPLQLDRRWSDAMLDIRTPVLTDIALPVQLARQGTRLDPAARGGRRRSRPSPALGRAACVRRHGGGDHAVSFDAAEDPVRSAATPGRSRAPRPARPFPRGTPPFTRARPASRSCCSSPRPGHGGVGGGRSRLSGCSAWPGAGRICKCHALAVRRRLGGSLLGVGLALAVFAGAQRELRTRTSTSGCRHTARVDPHALRSFVGSLPAARGASRACRPAQAPSGAMADGDAPGWFREIRTHAGQAVACGDRSGFSELGRLAIDPGGGTRSSTSTAEALGLPRVPGWLRDQSSCMCVFLLSDHDDAEHAGIQARTRSRADQPPDPVGVVRHQHGGMALIARAIGAREAHRCLGHWSVPTASGIASSKVRSFALRYPARCTATP